MHTFNETAAGVPAFLAKLWRLVEDPDTNKLIYWQSDGRSFVIQNQAQFARDLLPLNYKHNNMASFIRQLNMYGFHKITSIDNGGLKFDKDEMEFSHACFQKDQPYLLEHIKRKIANPKQPAVAPAALPQPIDDKATVVPEIVNKVMNDVKLMRSRQENLDSRFAAMKQENEALWREVAMLRQKHSKQQQIVNKLIQFLVTLVQPARGGGGINTMSGVKRRFQLMINDVPETSNTKNGKESSVPVIQELTEDLFDEVDYDYVDDDGGSSPNVMSPDEIQQSHDTHAEDLASPKYQMHQGGSNSFVDHPESDEDITDRTEADEFADNLNYIVDEESPANTVPSSPTPEWLESNILSPQQIKQEEPESLTIRSIHENNGRSQHRSHPYRTPTHSRPKHFKAESQKSTSLLNKRKSSQGLQLKINNVRPVSSITANTSTAKTSNVQNQPPKTMPNTRSSVGGKMISGLDYTTGKNMASTSSGKRISAAGQSPIQHSTLTANNITMSAPKGYTNKSDFISAEIPNELFDLQDGNSNGSSTTANIVQQASPMLGDLSNNPTLSEDYTKKVFGGGSGAAGGSTSSTADKNMAVTMYNNKGNPKLTTSDDVHLHLDSIQGDLESIKELFKSDDYTLDANTLMGNSSGGIGGKNRLVLSPSVDSELFNKIFGDLDAPYGLSNDFRHDDGHGSELMTYQQQPNFNTCSLFNADDFLNADAITANTDIPAADDEDIEPDYLSHDLNTPKVERKSISFRPQNL